MEPTTIKTHFLEEYERLVGHDVISRILLKAEPFKHNTILHVNATKFGGGVAEILNSMIPIMQELDLNPQWQVFTAPPEFYDISKKIHNAMQGNRQIQFTEQEIKQYLDQGKLTFKELSPDADFNIIHDPQPCPIIGSISKKRGFWIWRCHIDTSSPNPDIWKILMRFLPKYDALIFHKQEFAQPGIHSFIYTMPPSINPFTPKNQPMSEEEAKKTVEKFIPVDLPILTQISRFDPWKDPLGVIDIYRKVNEKVPCRLALIGSMASDDPEGIDYLEKVKKYAKNDPKIHILTNLDGVADLEVNAFQRISKVILQKSLREGFGLTVSEALWKETPVVAGNVGGIQLQIQDGINGYLITTIDEAADRTLRLLKDPDMAKRMGKAGKEFVKHNFLLINHIENYIDLFAALEKRKQMKMI